MIENLKVIGIHGYPCLLSCSSSLPLIEENNQQFILGSRKKRANIPGDNPFVTYCDPFFVNGKDDELLLAIWVNFSILEKVISLPTGWSKLYYDNFYVNCFSQSEAYNLLNGWAEKTLLLPDLTMELVNFGFCARDKEIRWKFHLLRAKLPSTKLSMNDYWRCILQHSYKDKTYEDFLRALNEMAS